MRNEQEVERYSREADLLLIGGAQMTHQPLLSACGATLRPVILMRDPLASLSDWLQAADTIRAAGNQQVILCEHGVRTLDRAQGITLDLAIVATLAAQQQYPLLVALPGQPAADIALPLLRAARAAGAHGALLAVGDDGLPLTAWPALRS